MAIIYTTNEVYSDIKSYENVINYAANLTKTQGFIGGSSRDLYDPATAIRRMKDVYKTYRLMYHKDISKLVHYYISFPPHVTADKDYIIIEMLRELCSIVGQEFQCFYGLHLLNPKPNSTDAVHIHFIVNRISYVNGGYLSDQQMMAVKPLMHQLIEDYGIELKD